MNPPVPLNEEEIAQLASDLNFAPVDWLMVRLVATVRQQQAELDAWRQLDRMNATRDARPIPTMGLRTARKSADAIWGCRRPLDGPPKEPHV